MSFRFSGISTRVPFDLGHQTDKKKTEGQELIPIDTKPKRDARNRAPHHKLFR
jgi:hypothetical protein